VLDLAAVKRDDWVTPVALAISFKAAWLSSFSPRSALLMSDAVTPDTFLASCSWVRPASVRAFLMRLPTLFAMLPPSLPFCFPPRPLEGR